MPVQIQGMPRAAIGRLGKKAEMQSFTERLIRNRIRNKAKLKPMELVDPRNSELRASLQKAEFTMTAGDDVVDNDAEDEGPTGSASDSE